jgi:hypothetical protein
VSGWYSDDDGDSIHTGAELESADGAFKELEVWAVCNLLNYIIEIDTGTPVILESSLYVE